MLNIKTQSPYPQSYHIKPFHFQLPPQSYPQSLVLAKIPKKPSSKSLPQIKSHPQSLPSLPSKPLWVYRPHQKKIIKQLYNNPLSPGCLLDHELGSGKTQTIIGAIERLRQHPNHPSFKETPVFVLTMKALVENFRNELEKSKNLQETRIDLYHIMTYDNFRLHSKKYDTSDAFIIIDEAHNFRTPNADRYIKTMIAAKKASKVFLLTGTPTVNYNIDMAALLNLVLADDERLQFSSRGKIAGYLPTTKKSWNSQFSANLDPIKNYTTCLISHYRENHNSKDYKLHFPSVTKRIAQVPMKPEHANLYRNLQAQQLSKLFSGRGGGKEDKLSKHGNFTEKEFQDFNTRMQGPAKLGDSKDLRYLAYMMAMRMACEYMEDSESETSFMPKIEYAVDMIIKNHRAGSTYKAMIYDNFIGYGVRQIETLLTHAGIPHVVITGQSSDVKSPQDIMAKVKQYNSGDVRVIVLSSAGAHGLDLKGTSQAFLLSPHWNHAKEMQAEARVIRYDSHMGLDNKSIEIVYVLAVINATETKPKTKTADEYLRELSLLKRQENDKLTEIISHHCIDCVTDEELEVNIPFFFKRKNNPKAPTKQDLQYAKSAKNRALAITIYRKKFKPTTPTTPTLPTTPTTPTSNPSTNPSTNSSIKPPSSLFKRKENSKNSTKSNHSIPHPPIISQPTVIPLAIPILLKRKKISEISQTPKLIPPSPPQPIKHMSIFGPIPKKHKIN